MSERDCMGYVLLRRLVYTVPLVVLVSMVTFGFLHLAPGGPVGVMTGNPKVTGEDLDRIASNYGLDRPVPVQYLCWFRQVFLRFDFGRSYVTGRNVSSMILERIPATLELMLSAFVLAIIAGGITGIVSAVKKGSLVDQVLSVVTMAGMSVPVFWLALVAIYVFSLNLGIFPAGGRSAVGVDGSVADRIRHLVLPASVLSLVYLASWSRYIRDGLIEAFNGEFIRTARAKGLGEWTVIMKHSLKNAVLPALTVMLMQLPTLFTGAVITETVFSWPGMGRLFFEGLQRQDHTRVLGIMVISSLLIILFNLAGDLLGMAIDPRIDKGRSSLPGAKIEKRSAAIT